MTTHGQHSAAGFDLSQGLFAVHTNLIGDGSITRTRKIKRPISDALTNTYTANDRNTIDIDGRR